MCIELVGRYKEVGMSKRGWELKGLTQVYFQMKSVELNEIEEIARRRG